VDFFPETVGERMNYEKSCGAIVYRKYHGNTEILLIKHNKSGYWSFPKGHMEKDETEAETALREIKEETGIDVLVDTGFRETVAFSPRKETIKTVVYFVARAINYDFVPQAEEISEIRWVEIGQALSMLTYENDKATVTKAKSFIALMK
jgi:8-oxo-dGTP pyrophosphatase MutT (NUDIX family)